MNEHTNCVPYDTKIENLEDTIQAMKFYPQIGVNYLATCGWDAKIRIFNIQQETSNQSFNNYSYQNNSQSQIKLNPTLVSTQQMNSPLLNLCWHIGNQSLISSDVDGGIFSMNMQNNQVTQLGKHTSGCKELALFNYNNNSYLISAGWDGFINFWDFRQQNPILSHNMNKKIYTMSLSDSLLVVGYEKRIIQYFNLNKLFMQNSFVPEAEFESSLKFQTRCISCLPSAAGYIIGSIEGRVGVKNLDLNIPPKIEKNQMNNQNDFSFRIHRQNNTEIYSVHTIAVNKAFGTFATGGGDGFFYIWDKKNRGKLKTGHYDDKAPITALEYNESGDILAYAGGYDWAQGIHGNLLIKPRIGLHYLTDIEKKEGPDKTSQINNFYRK